MKTKKTAAKPQYLILEKEGEKIYAYRQNSKRVAPLSRKTIIDPAALDADCNLANYGNFVMIFPLAEEAVKCPNKSKSS